MRQAVAMLGGGNHEQVRIDVGNDIGAVTGYLNLTAGFRALYLMAHGAGSDIDHPFMEAMARELGTRGIAVLRYRFPYREAGRRRIDAQDSLLATVRSAVAWARGRFPDVSLFAGGRSMGGRMTSLAASRAPLPGVVGLVFLGFPLHPTHRPGIDRAAHFARLRLPLLFVQGTRDRLCDLGLLRQVLPANGVLHIVEQADHGFDVLKRSGRSETEVCTEIAGALELFVADRMGV